MSVQRLLTDAVAAHQSGRLDEAAEGYRKVLRQQPQHIDAMHFLGLVERAQGRLEAACQRLERVVTLRPAFPAAFRAQE